MFRSTLFATIATVAVVAATPTLAKPGGGGIGVGAGGGIGASARGGSAADVSIGARGNAGARGSDRISDQAISRGSTKTQLEEPMTGTRIRTTTSTNTESRIKANANTEASTSSSLSASAQTKLTGVTIGTAVVDSSDVSVGTVTGLRTLPNGTIKAVQVTLTDGSVIFLSPNSLTLDGGVLTTTSVATNVNSQGATNASINGLIHANPRSALGAAGITTLTGLATGLTVNGTGGTSVGTVSSVLLNQSGAVVGITVDLTGGGTVTVPATTLTMNGVIVETTFLP